MPENLNVSNEREARRESYQTIETGICSGGRRHADVGRRGACGRSGPHRLFDVADRLVWAVGDAVPSGDRTRTEPLQVSDGRQYRCLGAASLGCAWLYLVPDLRDTGPDRPGARQVDEAGKREIGSDHLQRVAFLAGNQKFPGSRP